ncbi:hypothetical protein QZH41_012091 [Actinostola sp. cb2023]|nr:hypothetical protein QZH41_012091 [Actinostola sp. cb2023]
MENTSSERKRNYDSDDSSVISYNSGDEIQDEDAVLATTAMASIMEEEGPYADEPLADDAWLQDYQREREIIEERHKELQSRLRGEKPVDMWCSCGHCSTERLQNAKECQCCHELESCMDSLDNELVLQEVETRPNCITLHPGFTPVCLNKWSLRSSAKKYKTTDKRRYRQTGAENEFLRATAYREFTQLVYGYLGPRRFPLPACAYNTIRTEFMDHEETAYQFTGYEDNDDSEEDSEDL